MNVVKQWFNGLKSPKNGNTDHHTKIYLPKTAISYENRISQSPETLIQARQDYLRGNSQQYYKETVNIYQTTN